MYVCFIFINIFLYILSFFKCTIMLWIRTKDGLTLKLIGGKEIVSDWLIDYATIYLSFVCFIYLFIYLFVFSLSCLVLNCFTGMTNRISYIFSFAFIPLLFLQPFYYRIRFLFVLNLLLFRLIANYVFFLFASSLSLSLSIIFYLSFFLSSSLSLSYFSIQLYNSVLFCTLLFASDFTFSTQSFYYI